MTDEVYSRLAIESARSLLTVIDPNVIREAGWELFIKDVFDLTDALYEELQRRLVRNKEPAP